MSSVLAVLVVVAVLVLVVLAFRGAPNAEAASATGVTYRLEIHDPRVCAVVAVYDQATHDDWGQRAAIARATLNRFHSTGAVPDCGDQVGAALTAGLDQYRWQAALDAVDAVLSGSYALPLACARADDVIPLTVEPGSPPYRPEAARAQCVIGRLAFVETR